MPDGQVQEASANELAALIGSVWSETKTCAALGMTAQDLAARRRAGTVLALETSDGVRRYPVSQFAHRPDGDVEVEPALVPLLEALVCFDPWAVAVLMHTRAPELGDQTPLRWIRTSGSPDALAAFAMAVAREWSAGSSTA